jgi:hypothetical protein
MTWARSLQDGEPPETEQVVGGDRVTMIGRPAAGKSLLVGALLRQGRKSWHSFSDKDWMIIPNNAGRDDERNDIGELISLMNSFVQGRHLPATYHHRILNYSIRLECELAGELDGSIWSRFRARKPPKRSADILITDAAGGLIMGPDEGNQPRDVIRRAKEFTQIVRSSGGLIYCLPVGMEDLDLGAEYKQMAIIDDLIQNEEIGLERIVICLTKYEVLWAPYGCEAFDLARDPHEFHEVAKREIPADLLKSLIALANRPRLRDKSAIEVCIVPVSAFGFVRGNGCVNYNPITQHLLIESGGQLLEVDSRSSFKPPYYNNREAISYWQPFYILDPFIYAAFGEKGDLTVDVRELG